LQNDITKETLKSLEGGEAIVLLEGKSRKQDQGPAFWRGRDEAGRVVNLRPGESDYVGPDCTGPECAQAASVDMGRPGREYAGLMVRARIVAAKNHSLVGEKVGQPW